MVTTLPRRSTLLAALTLAALVVLAVPASAANVRLTDSGFEPRVTNVQTGETIVWTNSTESRQTITGADGSWDSGPLGPGETFSVQLRQPGTITFRTADGSATGTVVVAAAAPGSTASPAPALDPEEPALPRTGMPLLALGAVGFGLVLAGAFAVRRADA